MAMSSIIIPIIIIIIIILHQSDLDRPVSASSHILFKGLPKSSSPIWSTIQHWFQHPVAVHFSILLLLILPKRRSQFELFALSFSSTGPTFNCSKIS
jgi:hypothetical protein